MADTHAYQIWGPMHVIKEIVLLTIICLYDYPNQQSCDTVLNRLVCRIALSLQCLEIYKYVIVTAWHILNCSFGGNRECGICVPCYLFGKRGIFLTEIESVYNIALPVQETRREKDAPNHTEIWKSRCPYLLKQKPIIQLHRHCFLSFNKKNHLNKVFEKDK